VEKGRWAWFASILLSAAALAVPPLIWLAYFYFIGVFTNHLHANFDASFALFILFVSNLIWKFDVGLLTKV